MQGIGMVEVRPFDDDEATTLADDLPGLRPLLFSTPQVQQIARRPFFASVLARELSSGDAISAPRSEIDLTQRWWRGGGYNASSSEVLLRQRAIIDLARAACRQLGRPFALSRLKHATIDTLQALIVDADNYRLLEKVLVWFQAERTRPNDYILSHNAATKDLDRSEIIRYADAVGWPSDFATWQQMLGWIFARLDTLPKTLVPQILPVFEVWQNALRGIPNVISERIVSQAFAWLTSIEAVEHLLSPHRVLAIGRDAQLALEDLGVTAEKVRHPSYGGQAEFIAGVSTHYGLDAADRQKNAPIFA